MPGLDSRIFSIALILFLLISCAEVAIKQLINLAKLTIEQLISLVSLFKKLKATIESKYSLESEEPETRIRREPDETPRITPASQTDIHIRSERELDDNPPS